MTPSTSGVGGVSVQCGGEDTPSWRQGRGLGAPARNVVGLRTDEGVLYLRPEIRGEGYPVALSFSNQVGWVTGFEPATS